MKRIYIISIGLLCNLFTFAQLDTERILAIGRNALYFEDYVLSIQYFNEVIRLKPYLPEPYLFRGIAKIQLGDFQGADLDCSEAIERNPFLTQAYYARGFARRSLKFYKESVADFTKALEFNPSAAYLYLNRMDSKQRLEDYTGAMSDLDEYIKLSAKSANMYYEKGCLQLAMKDTLGAEKSFDECIRKDSTNAMGWSARAMLRMQRNDNKGALADYNQAIKRNSTYAGDYVNRGILNVQNKNYRQALSDYDNAIKYDKTSPLAYYNRGLLRTNLGDKNNALTDLATVVRMDSSNTEALLSKAELEHDLGDHRGAIRDYKIIIKRYPYFIPAYWGIAQSEQALGDIKTAYEYRLKADNIEKNKDNISRKQKQLKAANKMLAKTQPGNSSRKTEFFNRFADQNQDYTNDTDNKYAEDKSRGNVQDKRSEVTNEKNFVLTYYAKSDEMRRTNLFHPLINNYNKQKKLSTALKITNNELALTAELVNNHFEAINQISDKLAKDNENADTYFNRALEFSMVQDFKSAVENLNKALSIRPDFVIAYFCRANIRYKLIEYQRNNATAETDNAKKLQADKQMMFDVEMCMRDYDKVIELAPDFSFAYFNKANILCTQKDFKTALNYYNKAIETDPDFAEAYFNRGLTYLFTGNDNKGLTDLSKSGELGIYSAYNLIKRYKSN